MPKSSLRPLSPGEHLDDLLASRFLSMHPFACISSAAELPIRLQRCAKNLQEGSEWRAYGEKQAIFFAIARMHLARPPEDFGTAIDVYFLDANALVYAAGVWEYTPKNGWWLDAVMKPSYDSEHGWWFEAAMGWQEDVFSDAEASPSRLLPRAAKRHG
jgi:hypothetical protein